MSNFHMDITACGKEALAHCIELALMSKAQVTHWCDHPSKGLVLFWSKPEPGLKWNILDCPGKLVDKLPDAGFPGQVVFRKKNGYGTTYKWLSHQDDGGDPQNWRWTISDPLTEDVIVHQLPYRMKKAEDIAIFVNGWLEEAKYGPSPDHDGSNVKGFQIYNDRWGQVEDCGPYSFVAVKPAWSEIGK